MSLPERYSKRIKQALGARAVWQPGESVELGQVMVKRDGMFSVGGHISDFGATLQSGTHSDRSLDLASSGTRQRVFQANAELSGVNALDLAADASAKLEFTAKFEYLLKAPTLSGAHITNMLKVANQLVSAPGWRHSDFFIVEEVYSAAEWTFLGTERSGSTIDVSGKGSGILSFLTAGFAADVKLTGAIDLKLAGKGGALAMNLVRIRKNGSLNHG